ncbi:MAG TPA: SRPBCC domain-containing protein [bacterium]|nr:SRPBCC domain-containing protein [bacterium]
MKFEKEITVSVRPERVWAFLWDVDRVTRCLPGCKEARTIVPHERYEAVIGERVGPFKVQFPLAIQVLEARAPRRLRAEAIGRDAAMGSALRVTLDLLLEGQGAGSRLLIQSDVGILGKLGTLGHGIIQQKANGIMTQFAESMRKELEAEGQA